MAREVRALSADFVVQGQRFGVLRQIDGDPAFVRRRGHVLPSRGGLDLRFDYLSHRAAHL